MGDSLFGRSREEVEAALPDRQSVTCPICRCEPATFGVDFQGMHLSRCPTCGLEFQHPRPLMDQLAAAVYTSSYHPDEHRNADGKRARAYERQLSFLEQHITDYSPSLLDIGCGAGAFLRFARDRGWEIGGTDVVVTDAARQSGADLWQGELPNIQFGDARFCVIRFNHVLEHTQDPLKELCRARNLITDDGILFIAVPNIGGLSIRLKSWQSRLGLKAKRWKHYGALHHLWFFTPATLIKLVHAAGFDVVHWETPVSDQVGRAAWARAAVRWPLAAARIGGTLELYASPR